MLSFFICVKILLQMARFSNQKHHSGQKTYSTESVHLGTFIHPAGDLLVLKLEYKDIPYPNAPVLFNKKQIGKIDEVFGPVDDVYVAVKLDASQKAADFAVKSKFEAYKDKFIFKDRFLPREEVERNKEKNDKKVKKASDSSSKYGKSSKGSFINKKDSFGNKGSYNNKKDSFGNKDSYNNKGSYNNRDSSNNKKDSFGNKDSYNNKKDSFGNKDSYNNKGSYNNRDSSNSKGSFNNKDSRKSRE